MYKFTSRSNYDETIILDVTHFRKLKEDVEELLNLDRNFVIEKMKNDPEEMVFVLTSTLMIIDAFLEEILNNPE
ncbi:MAG: hypothetical protein IKH73_10095 [Erysipelotrichaceae bacterium]|nr:hypothetical protein [Erysipelotrichaceae bacterium]